MGASMGMLFSEALVRDLFACLEGWKKVACASLSIKSLARSLRLEWTNGLGN